MEAEAGEVWLGAVFFSRLLLLFHKWEYAFAIWSSELLSFVDRRATGGGKILCESGVLGAADASAVRTRAVSRPSFPSRARNCYGPTQLVYTQLQRANPIEALTHGTHTTLIGKMCLLS